MVVTPVVTAAREALILAVAVAGPLVLGYALAEMAEAV